MQVGIQVTKSVSFRGVQQEFSNQYNYRLIPAVAVPSEALLDELVSKERNFHSTDVSFVRGSVWSSGGTPGQNQMLFQKNLGGVGTSAGSGEMDRERAVLIRWPAGFDIRGLPVYLRKWYHSCGNFDVTPLAVAGILQNTAKIPAASREAIANLADSLRRLGAAPDFADRWHLCSAKGRDVSGPPSCHPYLEHHQLGDMWR